MRKLLIFSLILIAVSLFFFGRVTPASSDELDTINQQIDNLNKELNMSKAATAPLESQLESMQQQITAIKARVGQIDIDVAQKKQDIATGEQNFTKDQQVLYETIRDFYINSYDNSPMMYLLSAQSASDVTRSLAYQKATTDQDKAIITNLALTLQDLEQKKKDLEDEEARLSVTKANLDKQSADLDTIVEGAKAYQASLTSQIASLTARQQQILAQRLASLNIPLFASSSLSGCSSDIGKDPGFSPKFGFFTYGVPNRVGLNQYGAYGRARAGQSYDTILHAYYNFDGYQTYGSTQITVDGYHSYSLEDYVKRIYEVPNSWGDSGGMEALKAQAIAIRSYAVAYTNNGQGSICTTQECQVFQDQDKGGNWDAAVDATKGQVMMQGGQPVKAWFSSTHGGYIHSSGDIGWSDTAFTKNAQDASGAMNSFSDVNNNAYDKDSPWFYCDWGSRSQYNNTAWLKPEEVADIVNVIMLAQKDTSITNHLYQTDAPNPEGTDTWDAGRVKQELQARSVTPFNSISNISVSADFGSGRTTSVTVNGDAGSQTFSADIFVTYFDLRAPATIYIPQLGKNGDGSLKSPLFNIEH